MLARTDSRCTHAELPNISVYNILSRTSLSLDPAVNEAGAIYTFDGIRGRCLLIRHSSSDSTRTYSSLCHWHFPDIPSVRIRKFPGNIGARIFTYIAFSGIAMRSDVCSVFRRVVHTCVKEKEEGHYYY